MKYFVFSGDYYYPAPGWDDFKGAFIDKESAIGSARSYLEPTDPEKDGWQPADD